MKQELEDLREQASHSRDVELIVNNLISGGLLKSDGKGDFIQPTNWEEHQQLVQQQQ